MVEVVEEEVVAFLCCLRALVRTCSAKHSMSTLFHREAWSCAITLPAAVQRLPRSTNLKRQELLPVAAGLPSRVAALVMVSVTIAHASWTAQPRD